MRKEAFAVVRAEAAMMRSPSFSRLGSSSTITNSSFAVVVVVGAAVLVGAEDARWRGNAT